MSPDEEPLRPNLFVWESHSAEMGGGQWYTIAAMMPTVANALMPLITRDLQTAMGLEALARAHGGTAKEPVRLARYSFAEEVVK